MARLSLVAGCCWREGSGAGSERLAVGRSAPVGGCGRCRARLVLVGCLPARRGRRCLVLAVRLVWRRVRWVAAAPVLLRMGGAVLVLVVG